ncbi:glycosyltransferase family 2 protein [Polluticaenibacter yanchengensis]|uniref:Glycosyltransferase family 2 protein n=1 Tax=Polluticaenibacter yanchengensis TaxID=3014562 RepID=A0ABT4UHC9_9BACT|nr:glycosyltransferase family 2 protein [Chitinophagaceae bacterium LY-5]
MDLVSICVPTYNGEVYLKEALDSVKSQTYSNIELIISDDQSSDNTLKIVEAFKDTVNFPVYIFHHTPAGIGANWNNTIEKANGKYIKFLFQDDVLFDDCIEQMMFYITKYQLKCIASTREIIYDPNNESQKNWVKGFGNLQQDLNLHFNSEKLAIINKSLFKHANFFQNPFNKIGEPVCLLFEKALYHEIGAFNTQLKQILDYEYWYRILKIYPIGLLNQPLVKFRLHSNQTTAVNNESNLDESKYYNDFLFNTLFWQLSKEQKQKMLLSKFRRFKRSVKNSFKSLLRIKYCN